MKAIWIGIGIGCVVMFAVVLLKWDAIKQYFSKEDASTQPPPVNPWGNQVENTNTANTNTTGANNSTNTNNTSSTGSTNNTSSSDISSTSSIESSIDLNRVFSSTKSEENRLGQLILIEINKKEKKIDIKADGYFGKKSIEAFDKFFPFQRTVKPFTLKTLVSLAERDYGIKTQNGQIIDPTASSTWQSWKDTFLPKK